MSEGDDGRSLEPQQPSGAFTLALDGPPLNYELYGTNTLLPALCVRTLFGFVLLPSILNCWLPKWRLW